MRIRAVGAFDEVEAKDIRRNDSPGLCRLMSLNLNLTSLVWGDQLINDQSMPGSHISGISYHHGEALGYVWHHQIVVENVVVEVA